MSGAAGAVGEFISLVPTRPDVPFTPEEAVDAARKAFTDARLAYAAAQEEFGHLTSRLFARDTVTYGRLKSLRYQARKAVEKLLATEAALTRAIEAMEATR